MAWFVRRGQIKKSPVAVDGASVSVAAVRHDATSCRVVHSRVSSWARIGPVRKSLHRWIVKTSDGGKLHNIQTINVTGNIVTKLAC